MRVVASRHGSPRSRVVAALLVAAATPTLRAQDAPPAGTALAPSLGVSVEAVETRSRLEAGENGREAVMTLSPGLRYTSRAGLLRGDVDYRASITERRGIAATAGGEWRNALDAALVADAVPGRFTVDLRAGISQQALSAYGEQVTAGSARATDNRTEVRTITIAPRLFGPLGTLAEYDLRADASATRSARDEGADSNTHGASLSLGSPSTIGPLGWRATARERRIDYEDRAAVAERSALFSASWRLPDNARLELRGGQESVREGDVEVVAGTRTVGAGIAWTPSPRASLAVDVDDRYFGRAGRATLSYRLPRTVLSYAFAKDTSGGADSRSTLGATTLYELLFAASANLYPDPAQRDAAVRELLRSRGLDGSEALPAGFQSSAVSVVRRQELSAVWSGVRTTLSVRGFTVASSELRFLPGLDPIVGEAEKQHGYSSSLAYRLTPTTSLLAGGSRQMTFSTSTEAGNDLKSVFITLSDRLGRRVTASLGAVYTVFNSPTTPYRETSLTGALVWVF